MTDMTKVKHVLRSQRIELPSWALRQLGHPLQGVRPAGRPAHPVGEDRRRRAGAPAHRRRPDRGRCTSRGTRSTTTRAGQARRRTRAWPSAPSTPTCSRTTTTSSAASPTRTRAVRRKAIDHLLECVDVMDATGSRDLKLWFADGTNYPGQDDIRARQDRLAEALREVYDRLGRRPADAAGVQALRAGVLHHRRAGLGHVVRALPASSGRRRRWCSTPATTPPAPTSSSSWRSCCAPGGSAPSTSTPASTPTTT